MKPIFVIAFAAFVYFLFAFLEGFVVMKYWNWFIAPVFAGPALSYVQAVGLSLFIGFMMATNNPETFKDNARNEGDKDKVSQGVTSLLKRLFFLFIALLFGYVFQVIL